MLNQLQAFPSKLDSAGTRFNILDDEGKTVT